MSQQQLIGVGTTANDGTGDPLRTAFGKINGVLNPSASAATPTYLPALTTSGAAYHAVYANERLLASYVGPLARIDKGAVQLGAGVAGISPAHIALGAGSGADARIDTWYDQSNNGYNATQPASAYRPALRDDVLVNGFPALIFDGHRNAGGGQTTPTGPQVGLLFTHNLSRQNYTVITVLEPWAAIDAAVYDEYYGSVGQDLYIDSSNGGSIKFNGNVAGAAGIPPTSATVIVAVGGSGGSSLFVDGVKTTGSAFAAGTLTTGLIGYSVANGVAYNANARILARIAISGAISDADAYAITTALQTRYGIAQPALNINMIGDSIGVGDAATKTMNLWHYARQRISTPFSLRNTCVSGQTMAQAYAATAARDTPRIASGKTNYAIIQACVNDLGGGVTPSALYTNTLTPYVAALKTAGYSKVGVCTCLYQSLNSTNTASVTNAYNALVVANGAGADFVVNWQGDGNDNTAAQSALTTNALLYYDQLHPTSLLYSHLGPTLAAAINAAYGT